MSRTIHRLGFFLVFALALIVFVRVTGQRAHGEGAAPAESAATSAASLALFDPALDDLPIDEPTTPTAAQDPAAQDPAAQDPAAQDPASASAAFSPEMIALRDKIRAVLDRYHQEWVLNTRDHSAWEIMHAVVAYGVKTQVRVGGPEGELQSGIGILCFNRPMRSPSILSIENGKPIGTKGVGVQGHHGQLLAYIAQGSLQRDYPIYVGGQKFTFEDLIENEKLTCRMGEELTFKLIGLAHYLPSDAEWTAGDGQKWSISKLIAEEIKAPILRTAACGGTHRLMGLSYAVRARQTQGLPMKGEFARAEKYTADYRRYTKTLQNSDGSLSTQWFEYRESRPDLSRRLQTSGHVLEWLVYSLPENELQEPWVVKAVDYVATLLQNGRASQWEIGPLGHGLHGLAIYNRRVFIAAERRAVGPTEIPAADKRSAADGDGTAIAR